jgi:YlmC/YmxH family sporulation protein
MKLSDMQTKDVINVVDGHRLGFIRDVLFDGASGRIEAIVLPPEGRFFGLFGGGDEVVVPWAHVVTVGRDVILVKIVPVGKTKKWRVDS